MLMTLHLSVVFPNSPPVKGLNGEVYSKFGAYMFRCSVPIVGHKFPLPFGLLAQFYQVHLELTRFIEKHHVEKHHEINFTKMVKYSIVLRRGNS
jgi:hypothetical protein